MKAIVGTAAVAALATFCLMRAVGADVPGRPPGVSADEWAPISDTMGVVLVDRQMAAADAPDARIQPEGAAIRKPIMGAGGGAALVSPVTGYLMVKRGRVWQRLIIIEPVKGPGVAG